MGKAKVRMERINDQKSRNLTFKRRKDGMLKKLDELTKLCDIKAFMVIRYQENGNSDLQTHIWPPNSEDFSKIKTELYDRNQNSGVRGRSSGTCGIWNENIKEAEEEVKNNVARRNTNPEFLNSMTEQELRALASALGKKSEMIKSKKEFLKSSRDKKEGLGMGMSISNAACRNQSGDQQYYWEWQGGFSDEPLCRKEESHPYLSQKQKELEFGAISGRGIGGGNTEEFNYCQLDQPQLHGLGFFDRGIAGENIEGCRQVHGYQGSNGGGLVQNQSQIEDVSDLESWYSNMLKMDSSTASSSSAASASGFYSAQNHIISSDLANYQQQQQQLGRGGMGHVWDDSWMY